MASTSAESVILTGIRRDDQPATSVIDTPLHEPNIIVQLTTPIASIVIRSSRVFIQTLLSGSGLSAAGTVLNIEAVKHLQSREILILALASAAVCALQNTLELLGKLDQKFPLWRT